MARHFTANGKRQDLPSYKVKRNMPSMKSKTWEPPDYESPLTLQEWLRISNELQTQQTFDGYELCISGTALRAVFTCDDGQVIHGAPIFRPEPIPRVRHKQHG
jgi:hypothetical protein